MAARGLISMPRVWLGRTGGGVHFEPAVAVEAFQGVEYFAFEAFEVFKGDVEEVAGAAGVGGGYSPE